MGGMNEENTHTQDDSGERSRPSKSALKRVAVSLQELGVELAALPDIELGGLDLPENLVTALRELRRLPSHGARLRQRQYIGKLMRTIDPEPLVARLAERKRNHDRDVREFQQVERWRDRLLGGEPGALEELLAAYPDSDGPTLTRLVDKASKERDDRRSPAAARALFAYLKQLLA